MVRPKRAYRVTDLPFFFALVVRFICSWEKHVLGVPSSTKKPQSEALEFFWGQSLRPAGGVDTDFFQ